MKLWEFRRFTGLFVFCLAGIFTCAMSISAQDKSNSSNQQKRVVSIVGSTAEVRTYTIIPEATEPCAPAVCDWWNQIRKANADLNLSYQKRNDKSAVEATNRYFALLYEGQQKGYKVPLKDRPALSLIFGSPVYGSVAKKNRINGDIVLTIEISNDGTVREAQVTKGLGWGLDESAVQAARRTVFLPAIRDGAFVPQQSTMKFMFTQGCAGCSRR
jgi:TonB family protein